MAINCHDWSLRALPLHLYNSSVPLILRSLERRLTCLEELESWELENWQIWPGGPQLEKKTDVVVWRVWQPFSTMIRKNGKAQKLRTNSLI